MEKVKYSASESVPLTEVVDFIGGSQPPKSQFSNRQNDGYVRLIQIRDYKSDAHKVYVKKKSTKKFCNVDDVMIGRYGPPVFQILRGLEGAYNVALMKAVPKRDVLHKDYLFWFLQSPGIQSFIVGLSQRAAGQSGVNKSALEQYEILLLSLNEQKRIVTKLDALFTRIDTALSYLQESLELSKALFASETSRVFDQISNKYGSANLSKLVQINSGIALPKIFKDWKLSGSIPFYKVAQMNNDDRIMKKAIITFDSEVALAHKIKLFPKGSVLIPKRGGAILTEKKRILLEDASYDSNIMGLKADCKNITNEYLFRFLLSVNLSDYVDTSSIPQINNKHIDQMQIPLAPIEEQKHIVAHLDALAESTRILKATTQEKLDDLTALKASLLDAAFRGQL